MPELLSQQRKEVADQVISENTKLMKLWDERLHLGDLRLNSRWLDGSMIIAVRIDSENPREVCWFVCYGQKLADEMIARGEVLISYDEKLPMFVHNIKVMDFPKGFVAAFVRPQSIDSVLSLGGHACHLSSLYGFKILYAVGDGESTPFTGHIASGLNEMPSKMVECGTQIMDDVSGTRNKLEISNGQLMKSSLMIVFSDDGVVVNLTKGFGYTLKVSEVLVGPFGLYSNECKA